MKRVYFISIITCALSVMIASCRKQDAEPVTKGNPQLREINVNLNTAEMKGTIVDVTLDTIYAYSFVKGEGCNGESIKPSSIVAGVYTYMVSSDADVLMFSNRKNDATIDMSVTDDTLRFRHKAISDLDLVAGVMNVSPEAGTQYSTSLKRLAAKVTVNMEMVSAQGESLFIGDFIRSAEVRLNNQAYSTKIATDGTGGADPDMVTYTLTGQNVEYGTYSYNICSDISVLPTAPGQTTYLELVTTNTEGSQDIIGKDLGYAIEANKHYMLTLRMKRTDTGSQFVIDQIVDEEISVDLN